MTITWSRIHAALGLLPSPLTHAEMTQAVQNGLLEDGDLDWKQQLPEYSDKGKREFGKDVAAMANASGGLIVFGVEEHNEAATGICGVATDETQRNRLRSIAASWIRPVVPGLEVVEMRDASGGDAMLVVSVPASVDAPHVVGQRDQLGVPVRYGSSTLWLSEHEIQRAYRDRFERYAASDAALDSLLDDIGAQVDLEPPERNPWLVFAARPTEPAFTRSRRRPPADEARGSMQQAKRLAKDICPAGQVQQGALFHQAILDPINPRVGLRRWVIQGTRLRAQHDDVGCQIELHHDGAAAIRLDLSQWLPSHAADSEGERPHPVPLGVVQVALAESVAIFAAHACASGAPGLLQCRATLVKSDSVRPFGAFDNIEAGGLMLTQFTAVRGARDVSRAQAVEGEFEADAPAADLRGPARQLGDDLVHQFGVDRQSPIPE